LAAVTQWVHGEEDMAAFLAEVERVCKPGATFWLSTPNIGGEGGVIQHPHCHVFEFHDQQLMGCFADAGFTVNFRFNYRARPAEVERLLMMRAVRLAKPDNYWLAGMPKAFGDAYLLGALTWDDPVPGNVLYRLTTPVPQAEVEHPHA
jgi:hypothetical protein